MIINNLDNLETPEFTIIGSGPASITLALELANKGKKILIIEASSRYYSEESQDFYKGKVIGDEYFDLDHCRLRYLGGSTGHYNGRLHVYDEIDFDSWPIKKNDLDPYFNETKKIFEIKKKFQTFDSSINNFYLASHIVSPIRFGEKYYSALKNSKNIFLLLNSPVQTINQSIQEKRKVDSITLINNNVKKTVKVNKLILACGGIENSRILLWSREQSKTGFLQNHPIGNYWMEHPSGDVGQFIGDKKKLIALFKGNLDSRNMYLVPKPEFIRKNKLNNSRIEFIFLQNPQLSEKSFKYYMKDLLCFAPVYGKKLVESIQKKQMLHCNAAVFIQSEMKPDYENRITLSKQEVDLLGMPRVQLHWNVKNDFFNSSRKVIEELGKQFIKFDIGRLGIDRYIYDKTLKNIQTYRPSTPYSNTVRTFHKRNIFGGNHHMGGTCMSDSIKEGVVDSNLKVHTIDNFYIAGSSIFPTSGHWNPTFTIVQLSLRLAKHLTS